MNIPLFILGFIIFGKTYGLKTFIGTISLPLFTLLFTKIFGINGVLDYSKEMNTWLSCLFGGALSGLGIGLTMKSGSNTGGTDIIGQIISRFTSLPLGTSLLIINSLIILSSAFFFSLQSALFSIVASFLESTLIDRVTVFSGTGYAKSVYIISYHIEEIGSYIIDTLGRSGTIIKADGLYTKLPHPILMTVIPNSDLTRLVHFVNEIDKDAFIIVESDFHVLGNGYKKLSSVALNKDVTQKRDKKD